MEANGHNKDLFPGTWLIASMLGRGVGIIGRVHSLDGTKVVSDLEPDKRVPINDVLAARLLSLCPSFDFCSEPGIVPILKDGRMILNNEGTGPARGVERMPILMPRFHSLYEHPTNIFLGPGVILEFFTQMRAQDQNTYKKYLTSAMKAVTDERVAAAGITMATADDLKTEDERRTGKARGR